MKELQTIDILDYAIFIKEKTKKKTITELWTECCDLSKMVNKKPIMAYRDENDWNFLVQTDKEDYKVHLNFIEFLNFFQKITQMEIDRFQEEFINFESACKENNRISFSN